MDLIEPNWKELVHVVLREDAVSRLRGRCHCPIAKAPAIIPVSVKNVQDVAGEEGEMPYA